MLGVIGEVLRQYRGMHVPALSLATQYCQYGALLRRCDVSINVNRILHVKFGYGTSSLTFSSRQSLLRVAEI